VEGLICLLVYEDDPDQMHWLENSLVSVQQTAEFFPFSGLALPYGEYLPTEPTQLAGIALVSGRILRPLFLPEVSIRSWHHSTITALVHVKEAAVDEDGDLAAGHNDVRLPRQIAPVQAIAESHFRQ